MIGLEVCIDVPDLERAICFYAEAFGFATVAQPYCHVAVLQAEEVKITLLEKREQTQSSPNTTDVRRYDRHWTPVHLDFHVDDINVALDRVLRAGAMKEQFFESAEHGSAAFCADPFGHGFCLLQRR